MELITYVSTHHLKGYDMLQVKHAQNCCPVTTVLHLNSINTSAFPFWKIYIIDYEAKTVYNKGRQSCIHF